MHVAHDGGARVLPVKEAVAGRVVHQQIDLFVDLESILVERFPVQLGRRAIDESFTDLFPGFDRTFYVFGSTCSANRLGTPGGDLKVLGKQGAKLFDLIVERRAHLRVSSDPLPRECRAHCGEIGRRRARVIDRHQRFVERFVDQDTRVSYAEGRVDT